MECPVPDAPVIADIKKFVIDPGKSQAAPGETDWYSISAASSLA